MPRSPLPAAWPPPADPLAAERLTHAYAAGRGGAAGRRDPRFRAMLAAVGGNSPYLSDLIRREPCVPRAVRAWGTEHSWNRLMRFLGEADPGQSRARLAAHLRRVKRQGALLIALADLGGVWDVARVTAALSELAEKALDLAVAHLHPSRRGFVALGMGKLGGRELNYSSDVDLILLYDPAAWPGEEELLPGRFTRLARSLIQLIEARDADGYVFRVDLRLRPNPSATPPALSLPAALTYYESMAQGWERAAMIKARPVAGDESLGERFLEEIRPFVWRRGLDFAAIAELRGMKERIDAGRPGEGMTGFDAKLGRGGIREVEFIAQGSQMVWGGREPALRIRSTVPALKALARAGKLERRSVAALIAAYRFLRRLEHRLQMIEDRQTHALPTTTEGLRRVALMMGFPGSAALDEALRGHAGRVRAIFDDLFHAPLAREGAASAETLRGLGFEEPDRAMKLLMGWREGRHRALRSDRARGLLALLETPLLSTLARRTDHPDHALARVDELLSRLPAGVQILSLLAHNPPLLERLAAVLGASPALADHLARNPAALEGLLSPDDGDIPFSQSLAPMLEDARDTEDAVRIFRHARDAEAFRLSVLALEGRLGVDRAGPARTAMADTAIRVLLPRVCADMRMAFEDGLAVVALGKAGGEDMMAGSDLDLMLIHRGEPSRDHARLAQRLITALTAPGLEGPLHQVDMRLRPSGGKGPVAVALEAFRRYHHETAQTWERMALVRARVVAGPDDLRGEVEDAIIEALGRPEPAGSVMEDARRMRGRLLRERPAAGPWDIRNRAGGLMDVEFIAQGLALLQAPSSHRRVRTRDIFRRLVEVDALKEDQGNALIQADLLWREIQASLRLITPMTDRIGMPGHLEVLAANLPAMEPANLAAMMEDTASGVRRLFRDLVGDPGYAL